MANSRMLQELCHLGYETNVADMVSTRGMQLRGREVPQVDCPVLPPRVSSAPIEHPDNTLHHSNMTSQTDNAHDSMPTMASSDVESIDRCLDYATSQLLRERYRLTDTEESMSGDTSSPTVMNRGQSETPDSHYLTPITRQPVQSFLPDNEVEIDVDDPLPDPQQRPNQVHGEVYFNHHEGSYQTLREKHNLDLQNCAIYHAQHDKCFYFSCDR